VYGPAGTSVAERQLGSNIKTKRKRKKQSIIIKASKLQVSTKESQSIKPREKNAT
jgi:hypothetical protein